MVGALSRCHGKVPDALTGQHCGPSSSVHRLLCFVSFDRGTAALEVVRRLGFTLMCFACLFVSVLHCPTQMFFCCFHRSFLNHQPQKPDLHVIWFLLKPVAWPASIQTMCGPTRRPLEVGLCCSAAFQVMTW